jgi:hypothetical protein
MEHWVQVEKAVVYLARLAAETVAVHLAHLVVQKAAVQELESELHHSAADTP